MNMVMIKQCRPCGMMTEKVTMVVEQGQCHVIVFYWNVMPSVEVVTEWFSFSGYI